MLALSLQRRVPGRGRLQSRKKRRKKNAAALSRESAPRLGVVQPELSREVLRSLADDHNVRRVLHHAPRQRAVRHAAQRGTANPAGMRGLSRGQQVIAIGQIRRVCILDGVP